MSTSMTMSIPLIPTGEGDSNGTMAIVLNVNLKRDQALPLIFMNTNVISRLVYEHTFIKLLVIQ